MKQLSRYHNWPVNLTLTVGVIVTLITALMMSQLDALQLRSAPALVELPVINTQGVDASGGQVIHLNAPVGAAVVAAEGLDPLPTPSAGGETPSAAAPPIQANNAPSVVCGQVPAGWVLHTVQAGETLNTLAIGTQTSVENLRAANCLQPSDEVSAGMQILVPQQVVVVACGPPLSWIRYQVRSGETLGLLASRYNVSAAEIMSANCLTSSDLAAGKIIYLPPAAVPGAPTARPSAIPTIPVVTSTPQPSATSTNVPPSTPVRPQPTIPGQPTTAPTVIVPPTAAPTSTPPFLPTATAPRPSSTPRPTEQPPTNTPAPPPTSTPQPPPTNTLAPPPTDTPVPPTSTPQPPPTNTPVPPPTDTPQPPPTDTPVPPPTDTPEPPPTAEPTATSEPDPTDEPPPEPESLALYWPVDGLPRIGIGRFPHTGGHLEIRYAVL